MTRPRWPIGESEMIDLGAPIGSRRNSGHDVAGRISLQVPTSSRSRIRLADSADSYPEIRGSRHR